MHSPRHTTDKRVRETIFDLHVTEPVLGRAQELPCAEPLAGATSILDAPGKAPSSACEFFQPIWQIGIIIHKIICPGLVNVKGENLNNAQRFLSLPKSFKPGCLSTALSAAN